CKKLIEAHRNSSRPAMADSWLPQAKVTAALLVPCSQLLSSMLPVPWIRAPISLVPCSRSPFFQTPDLPGSRLPLLGRCRRMAQCPHYVPVHESMVTNVHIGTAR